MGGPAPERPLAGGRHAATAASGAEAPAGEDRRAVPDRPPQGITRSLTLRLYTSHLLSTWNSRLFEFGAVLFLASIFPGTLMPLSVYALVRSAAAILFAQAVGSWIDRGDRLLVIRVSIVGQRLAVAASCGAFWVMERRRDALSRQAMDGLFALTVLLACVEKLCSVMNLVAVERDWVVVITDSDQDARRGSFSVSSYYRSVVPI